VASREVGLEVNTEKCVWLCLARKSFENMKKSKHLGTTVTYKNCIHEEIKSRLNSGNVCYRSVQSLLSSCLLSKNVKIKIHKTIILPTVLYGYQTWSRKQK
jgi:hypothetical protein